MSDKKDGSKKGGLGSLLHNIVFEDESSSQGEKSSSSATTSSDKSSEVPVFATRRSNAPYATSLAPSVSASGADPEQMLQIEQMLEKRNGPAYIRFNSILGRLSSIPDEDTRITAALSMAPEVSLDPASIRAAYDDRLKNLDVLQGQFEEQSEREYEKRVKDAEEEVREMDERVAELKRQIDALTSTRSARTVSVTESKREISSIKESMLASFVAIKAKITTERDTIARHI